MLVNRHVWGVSMNSRRNRRWLLVMLYLFIGLLIVLALQKHISGLSIWLVVFVIINPLIFGDFMFWGKKYGGLLKPFHQEAERPNDERELAARDSAHFRAYTALVLLLFTFLIAPDWVPTRYRDHLSATELLFYTRTSLWGLFAIATTLPQAILLWSEPDVDSEPEEQNTLAIPKHLR
jgi:hypothetical protein